MAGCPSIRYIAAKRIHISSNEHGKYFVMELSTNISNCTVYWSDVFIILKILNNDKLNVCDRSYGNYY